MLTVCFLWTQCFLGIQNWTTSLLTHFSWQTLSLKVYLSAIQHEGQGHKNSSRFPNNCLTNVNVFGIAVLGPMQPNISTVLNTPWLLFMDPCSFLPLTDILSICFWPKHFTRTSHLPTPLKSTVLPVSQPSVSFRLNIQAHRAVRYTGRRLTHCTSEPKP